MHVKNIFLAFLPLRQSAHAHEALGFALFGYGNERFQIANKKQAFLHVTVKVRFGGGASSRSGVKTSDKAQRIQCREKQGLYCEGNFVSMKLRNIYNIL